MAKKKVRVHASIPKRLYAEIHERHLYGHVSFLVACLLEEFLEFLERTDGGASLEKLPTKLDQELYLTRKLEEFFSEIQEK
jgi:hypothetical protein